MILSFVIPIPAVNPPPDIVFGQAGSALVIPNGPGSNRAIRIGNYSPFVFMIKGVHDSQHSTYIISPYTMNVYGYSNVRGNVTMTATSLATDVGTFPPNMHVSVEWTEDAHDFRGVYPANLGGTALMTINQGQDVPGAPRPPAVPVRTYPGEPIEVTLAGDSMRSILAVKEASHGHDDGSSTGGSGSYTDITFAVPTDTSFNYFVEWDLNGVSSYNTDNIGYDYSMYAQILGQSPGVGFENYGYFIGGGPSTGTPGGALVASGHGHRIEQVEVANYGTTITLIVFWSIATTAPTRIRHVDTMTAKLLAVSP